MKRLFKFGLMGIPAGIGLVVLAAMFGGFGPCTGSTAGILGLVAGMVCAAAAGLALIISGPTLLVRKLRTQEVIHEGTL
jgi:hypothetical protein